MKSYDRPTDRCRSFINPEEHAFFFPHISPFLIFLRKEKNKNHSESFFSRLLESRRRLQSSGHFDDAVLITLSLESSPDSRFCDNAGRSRSDFLSVSRRAKSESLARRTRYPRYPSDRPLTAITGVERETEETGSSRERHREKQRNLKMLTSRHAFPRERDQERSSATPRMLGSLVTSLELYDHNSRPD